MIARSALPFPFRNMLNRVGLATLRQRIGFSRGLRPTRRLRIVAALGQWSKISIFEWHSEILLRSQPERFRRFCSDCGRDTPHQGSDEFGAGWYAQICRCRHCGKQGMRVWPLAWW